MDPKLKVITQLPLRELWRDNGFKSTSRDQSLTQDDVANLLRAGPVQFVVADVGFPPQWIQPTDCYRLWKDEIKPHLAHEARTRLSDFPDNYCYFASRWNQEESPTPIVVFEKSH